MGQEDEGGLTQDEAMLLWNRDPEGTIRRFCNDAITLMEICAAVHFEAKHADASTELSVIFEPYKEILKSTRESAKNLWWCTSLPDYLTRSSPVIVVSRGDLRSRLDGSCYHEVAINCADCLWVAANSIYTAGQHAADLRFQTARGDLVTDYLKSLAADIRCESRDGIERFRLDKARGDAKTNGPSGQPVSSQSHELSVAGTQHRPSPFTGGTLEFLVDSVKLCGVGICSGGRPKRMRTVLELLRQKRTDGGFVSYSGPKLAQRLGVPAENLAGIIRDLRDYISEALCQANIRCGMRDVILSRGSGYRLSEKLSVHEATNLITIQNGKSGPEYTDRLDDPRDTDDTGPDRNDTNPDARDTNPEPHDTDPDPHDTDDLSTSSSIRQAWILKEIATGRRLQVSDIIAEFGVSKATSKRDLKALRLEGKIQFVGTSRQGCYELSERGSGQIADSGITPESS